MAGKIKEYNINFDYLFDSKEQAVVQFLSLEKRYLKLCKDHRAEMEACKEANANI